MSVIFRNIGKVIATNVISNMQFNPIGDKHHKRQTYGDKHHSILANVYYEADTTNQKPRVRYEESDTASQIPWVGNQVSDNTSQIPRIEYHESHTNSWIPQFGCHESDIMSRIQRGGYQDADSTRRIQRGECHELGIHSFVYSLFALLLKIAHFNERPWAICSHRSFVKSDHEQIALVALC